MNESPSQDDLTSPHESTSYPPQEPDVPSVEVPGNGRGLGLGIGQAAAQAWDEAVQETRARQTPRERPSREWFARLPGVNRFLLGSGGACLLAGLFCLIGLPLLGSANSSLQAAVHPFTSEGRSEACLSNLQRVALALAQYRSDYDDQFPAPEYKSGGKRQTWMAQLRERGIEANAFVCAAGGAGGDLQTTGSYGFNPVLAGQSLAEGEAENGAGRMVLLADRGEKHDSILLPPFVGWPPHEAEAGGGKGNLSANHGASRVAVLYADGHAETRSPGSWTEEAASWGGPLLAQASLKRLEVGHPLLAKIKSAPAKSFAAQKVKLRQGLEELRLLDRQMLETQSGGHEQSDKHELIDKRLWKGAGVLRAVGDGQLEQELTAALRNDLQSQSLQTGDWQRYESEHGFALQYPASWPVEHEEDGRYHRTYFRSPSPHLHVMVERGERLRPTDAAVIDWTGMERALKKQLGSNYRRISLGRSTLGGREVSVWECEIRKSDGPKLRKKYLGYSSPWHSVILVSTTPAVAWNDWQGHWERVAASFEFRD